MFFVKKKLVIEILNVVYLFTFLNFILENVRDVLKLLILVLNFLINLAIICVLWSFRTDPLIYFH